MALSEWREVPLADVAEEVTVGYVGPMATEYVAQGVPFLRSLNVEPYRINTNDLKFIRPEFHVRLQKSRLRAGDLVIVRTGRPGTAAVIPHHLDDSNCSDLVVVRPNKQLDARFAAYLFNSAIGRHTVNSRIVGSVQSHFNIGHAKTAGILLPPILVQRQVSNILGALDDKID